MSKWYPLPPHMANPLATTHAQQSSTLERFWWWDTRLQHVYMQNNNQPMWVRSWFHHAKFAKPKSEHHPEQHASTVQNLLAIQLPARVNPGDLETPKKRKNDNAISLPSSISNFTFYRWRNCDWKWHSNWSRGWLSADMSWRSEVFLGRCLSSLQIGRIVWAETLHVEFHPKIRPGNPSLQDPAGCQPHPRRTIINRGIYDFCLLFVSMHSSCWFCPSRWAGAHLTNTGTALVRLTWAYTTTIESMDFEIWPPWLSDGDRVSSSIGFCTEFFKTRKKRKLRQPLPISVVKFHPSH